jgi:hypothetical protein
VGNDVPIKKLILVPAVVTLAVTLLRLAGELLHWSPILFNPKAGGRGALIGIAWLVPIFGAYFGVKLASAGRGPAAAWPAIGYSILGFALVPAIGLGGMAFGLLPRGSAAFGVFVVLSIIGAIVAYRAWPALGQTLLAYALAARVPVVVVMLFAILGSWGTHYDVAPPDLPSMSPIAKWFFIGAIPQFTLWIWFTIAGGMVCGAVAMAVVSRGQRPSPA